MAHPTFDTLEGWFRADHRSSDPYLRETLFELEYCDTFDGFESEREFLDHELSSTEMIARLKSALTNKDDALRGLAAKRLISTSHPESEAILLRFLRSDNSEDRSWVAESARFVDSDEVNSEIANVALRDPKCYIRANACKGMVGKNPCVMIPVLLEVVNQGDDNVDPNVQTMPPCVVAREMLETLLGTSFFKPDEYYAPSEYEKRRAALEKRAIEVLQELKCPHDSDAKREPNDEPS
jgi:hypothetical protein